MRRRLQFTKAERPEGAVIPRLLPSGTLLCPRCEGQVRTPTAWNPFNGKEEPMILIADKTATCPHCGAVHFFPGDLARAFNRNLYPGDEQFWSPLEN